MVETPSVGAMFLRGCGNLLRGIPGYPPFSTAWYRNRHGRTWSIKSSREGDIGGGDDKRWLNGVRLREKAARVNPSTAEGRGA